MYDEHHTRHDNSPLDPRLVVARGRRVFVVCHLPPPSVAVVEVDDALALGLIVYAVGFCVGLCTLVATVLSRSLCFELFGGKERIVHWEFVKDYFTFMFF